MPYLCGLWRFANAYFYYKMRGFFLKAISFRFSFWENSFDGTVLLFLWDCEPPTLQLIDCILCTFLLYWKQTDTAATVSYEMEVPLCHKIILANLYNNPEKPKDLHRKISVTGSASVIKPYPNGKTEFPIVKDTTPNMMNPRLYTTSYNKPQGQQFETAVLSFIKLQYT